LSLSNKVWYFAYGSNLNVDEMNSRVGEWHLSKRALARNFRLVFNVKSTRWQGNAANLQPSERFEDVVYGVVYLLNEEQLRSLAKKEGVDPVTIGVELEDGNEIPHAKTFIWKATGQGTAPSEHYRRSMEEGLLEHGYKKAVVDRILGVAAKR
jgi:cation transport regulator ChaC